MGPPGPPGNDGRPGMDMEDGEPGKNGEPAKLNYDPAALLPKDCPCTGVVVTIIISSSLFLLLPSYLDQRNLEAKGLVVLRAFLVRLENLANLEWTENWETMVLEVNPANQAMPANRDPRDQPVTKGRLYRRVLCHRDLLENQELMVRHQWEILFVIVHFNGVAFQDQSALSVRLVWLAKTASMVLLVLKVIWELQEKTDKRDPRANQVLRDHQGPKVISLRMI